MDAPAPSPPPHPPQSCVTRAGETLYGGRPQHRGRASPTAVAKYTFRSRPATLRTLADHSAIEWTEATWNPTSGCTKVSPGCDRCYAERITRRFPKAYPNGFELTLRPQVLELPLRWRRPRTVFVNSMSDVFHTDVPESYIASIFDVMCRCPHHTFQVLTKRAERLARLASRLPWPQNVWMGVSVESDRFRWRIDYLRHVSCGALPFRRAAPHSAAGFGSLRGSLGDRRRRESERGPAC
jgi:hypothetical protein